MAAKLDECAVCSLGYLPTAILATNTGQACLSSTQERPNVSFNCENVFAIEAQELTHADSRYPVDRAEVQTTTTGY